MPPKIQVTRTKNSNPNTGFKKKELTLSVKGKNGNKLDYIRTKKTGADGVKTKSFESYKTTKPEPYITAGKVSIKTKTKPIEGPTKKRFETFTAASGGKTYRGSNKKEYKVANKNNNLAFSQMKKGKRGIQ